MVVAWVREKIKGRTTDNTDNADGADAERWVQGMLCALWVANGRRW